MEQPVQLSLNIGTEQVNRALADAILQSGIGKVVYEAFQAEIARLGNSYNSPLHKLVQTAVAEQVRELLQDEFADQIRERVREHLTAELMENVVHAAWSAFMDKLNTSR